MSNAVELTELARRRIAAKRTAAVLGLVAASVFLLFVLKATGTI